MNRRIDAHPFSRLSREEQSLVCSLAEEHAVADRISPIRDPMEMKVDVLGIRYPNGIDIYHVGLICLTLPRLYLRLDENSPHRVKIMEERNQYMEQRYEFRLEIIQFVTHLGNFELDIIDTIRRRPFISLRSIIACEFTSRIIRVGLYFVYFSNCLRTDCFQAPQSWNLWETYHILYIARKWSDNRCV